MAFFPPDGPERPLEGSWRPVLTVPGLISLVSASAVPDVVFALFHGLMRFFDFVLGGFPEIKWLFDIIKFVLRPPRSDYRYIPITE